ncbi:MAG: ATP-binding cassette domain-containing protein [Candidatus Micrarchaeaceae archaeon]
MTDSITVKALSKKYGNFTAVDNISFNVKSGEIFGFLGPNGAGKTTTVHMLTTIIDKTSGDATVAGFDISKDKENVRNSIGIVFQDPSLDDRLTGYENLDFHATIYGIGKAERKKRIAEMLDMVELSDKAHLLVQKYSGGMRRRLEIARGLLNQPKVLFLDEPTIGLDAQTRRHILDYIKNLNKKYGITVLVTTHYIEEADYVCNRVAIIDHGKIVACDTPEQLKKKLEGDAVIAKFSSASEASAFSNKLKTEKLVKTTKEDNVTLYIYVKDAESTLPKIMNIAYKSNIKVASVEIHKPSLEDVFIYYTGKSIRDSEAEGNERMRGIMRSRMR